MTTQQCPRCDGKGETLGDWGALANCSYCGGTGQLAACEGDPGFLVDTCQELVALREECVALRVVAMAAQGLCDADNLTRTSPETITAMLDELRDALTQIGGQAVRRADKVVNVMGGRRTGKTHVTIAVLTRKLIVLENAARAAIAAGQPHADHPFCECAKCKAWDALRELLEAK